MNNYQTVEQLEKLKLHGMALTLKTIMGMPIQQRPTFEESLAKMIENEILDKNQAHTERLLRNSKLRFKAPLEEIICSSDRNLSKEVLMALSSCHFIEERRHVLILGKTGVGKSYLACAIGRRACQLGYKVVFLNMVKFSESIITASLAGNYIKCIDQYMKNDLFILDDFGICDIDEKVRLAIYQLLEGFNENYKMSMIITSQLPVDKWYEYLKSGSKSESILDRLLANEHRIELTGKSMRRSTKIS